MRIQILNLPSPVDGDWPFALILDEVSTEQAQNLALNPASLEDLKSGTGALHVAVFDTTVEVL